MPLPRRARPAAAILALAIGLLTAAHPATAPAAARAPTSLDLAIRFRPHLFFDSAERWRPIDVDAFLTEPGHQACPYPSTGAPCVPLRSIAQLTAAVPYIDLRGTHANGSDAKALDLATCAKSKPTLLDCDEAGRSLIYAHVTRAPTRVAIDYWWFLRYNAFSLDLHEGDWEGVTVIVDAAGRRVESVHFPAHAGVWHYPAGVAEIDGARHVRVYLARGTHAAYPRPCTTAPCRQTASVLPDGRFDGRSPWVDNGAAACAQRCVRLLPQVAGHPASWDAWNGLWGAPRSAIFAPPRTPAFQDRYLHPFAATSTQRRDFSGPATIA
jgi:hypothetical protein